MQRCLTQYSGIVKLLSHLWSLLSVDFLRIKQLYYGLSLHLVLYYLKLKAFLTDSLMHAWGGLPSHRLLQSDGICFDHPTPDHWTLQPLTAQAWGRADQAYERSQSIHPLLVDSDWPQVIPASPSLRRAAVLVLPQGGGGVGSMAGKSPLPMPQIRRFMCPYLIQLWIVSSAGAPTYLPTFSWPPLSTFLPCLHLSHSYLLLNSSPTCCFLASTTPSHVPPCPQLLHLVHDTCTWHTHPSRLCVSITSSPNFPWVSRVRFEPLSCAYLPEEDTSLVRASPLLLGKCIALPASPVMWFWRNQYLV